MALSRKAGAAAAERGLSWHALLCIQRRWYTPPSRRTWSKQHYRIRAPRPLVDRFDISREQPQKEWWRERRVAPATFFGFPDVTKYGLRGGSLYVEQMDSVTLAVLGDKCVKENIWDPDIWEKFAWRAQQIASRTHEPDLCYIFRAFSRADWLDQNLLTTYLGRLHRRLHMFQLPDVAVLLEAFANPRFRQSTYLNKTLLHLALLLQHRDDAKAEDLARTCAALRELWPLPLELAREVQDALGLIAEALLLRDLTELNPSRSIGILDCYVGWGLFGIEGADRQTTSADLCWALARDLRGQLREHGHEQPDDLAKLAFAMGTGGLSHTDLWEELVTSLAHLAHRLSGPAAAAAACGAARGEQRSPHLYEALARSVREHRSELSALDCARAASGFLRGPRKVAEEVVLRGPIFDRVLELGFDAFDAEALTQLLSALGRAPPSAWGVELAAGSVLEALHPRLNELSARQVASVVRSLGYLRPEAPDVLRDVFDRAQELALDSKAGEALAPRHIAMLCQGIAAQESVQACNVPTRLQSLLPVINEALAAGPTAFSAAQILSSLVHCPASADRDVVLDACAQKLASKAYSLPASGLVNMAESMAKLATASAKWTPPDALLKATIDQLDTKRYDLAPGTLWKAAHALEVCGAEPGALTLEPRDMAS